jgi:hypothetical protein
VDAVRAGAQLLTGVQADKVMTQVGTWGRWWRRLDSNTGSNWLGLQGFIPPGVEGGEGGRGLDAWGVGVLAPPQPAPGPPAAGGGGGACRRGLHPYCLGHSNRDHFMLLFPSSMACWLASQLIGTCPTLLTCVGGWCVLCALQQVDGNRGRSKRAVGVQASCNSSNSSGQPDSSLVRIVVHAPIVVSSCGSIHTPALLLRSGITGGGTVGTNLRLHPATGLVAQFERTPQQAAAGKGAVNMYTVSAMASGLTGG